MNKHEQAIANEVIAILDEGYSYDEVQKVINNISGDIWISYVANNVNCEEIQDDR